MRTIKELQAIDLKRIKNKKLRDWTKDILKDYELATDKSTALEIAQASMDKVYELIARSSPEALPNPCADPEEEKKESKKEKKPKAKQTVKKDASKTSDKTASKKPKSRSKPPREVTKKKINAISEEIKQCRLKIKRFNEEKRKVEGPKRAPTRYEKIKKHFIAIGNQIPDRLKGNLKVQQQTERILLRAHRQIIDTYGMSKLKAEKDREAIKEKYERIEEKIENK